MTTKLTDTQLVILSAACGREDGAVFPVTAGLKGGALDKVLHSLIAKGLVEEVPVGKGDTAWREEAGQRLRATAAAYVALGLEPPPTGGEAAVRPAATDAAPEADTVAQAPVRAKKGRRANEVAGRESSAPTGQTAARNGPKVREGTKQAALIDMLRRKEGATIDEIVAATGWLPHTVRGAIAGALRKKLGLDVLSEKREGRGRVYHLPPAA